MPSPDFPPLDTTTDHLSSPTDIPVSDPEDDLDLHIEPPSSAANALPFKNPKNLKHRADGGTHKGKGRLDGAASGPCYLLDLPGDVLHLLLVRLPPQSLLQLGSTCKTIQAELKGEAMWRQCYMNHFMWEGASSSSTAREEAKVLVQGCMGTGGRGWKRETLSREGMIERWTTSRTSNVVHHPMQVPVYAMSLSYPLHLPGNHKSTSSMVVGKMSAGSGSASPASSSPLSSKLSHRQKYEAMLAVSSRPAPVLFCAGMELGALVKSDPLTGKVTKGFWGPGHDANFHLRPHWGGGDTPPSAIFIPKRSQTHMLWGLLSGSTVHTTIQTRSHGAHSGRANSVNVTSKPQDMHEGAIVSISQPESSGVDPMKWVTGGEDGRLKYWQLIPGTGRSGKKTPTDGVPASIQLLFAAEPVETPHINRSEEVKLRQVARPDPIVLVACDTQHDIVCGVTEDGDLRLWFNAAAEPHEVRVDVGSAEELGGVRRLFLVCNETSSGLVASVIVHHYLHPNFTRYNISLDDEGKQKIKPTFYSSPAEGNLTVIEPYLQPTPPIAQPSTAMPTLSARIVTPSSVSGSNTPVEPELNLDTLPKRLETPEFGRFVVAGDEHGQAYIWEWEGRAVDDIVMPLREWAAAEGKITAVDASCGLVAIGSYSGHVDIFDPLPHQPVRVRSFRPPGHLSPGDLLVAASNDHRARTFNVNHIILENDFVCAAIGRKVLSWRAGTGKGRQSGKEANARKGQGGGKGEFRGHSRALDLRHLHRDAEDSHYEIQAENEATRAIPSHDEEHLAAMQDLGLSDGDAALQYALMLSQQEADAEEIADADGAEQPDEGSSAWPQPSASSMSDDEAEAIRAVEEFERAQREQERDRERASAGDDPEDLAEILEMIRLAEERERNAR